MNSTISITVEDFGPISGPLTIQLNQFVVFSGDSGLGKSYLAMLVHFVYKVISGDELYDFLEQSGYDYETLKQNVGDEESIICKIPSVDMIQWINQRSLSFMRDMLGNQKFNAEINIVMSGLPEHFTFLYSRKAVMGRDKEEMAYVESLKLSEQGSSIQLPQETGKWGTLPLGFLISECLRLIFDIKPTRTFFMPPSRGSIVAIPDYLLYTLRGTMGMYIEFLNNLSKLKSLKPAEKTLDCDTNALKMLHSDVLHGDIELSEKDILYKIEGGDNALPITAAASSVKELVPFALIIQKGLMGSYSILFEEPESHLHPDMQIKVADLIGYALNGGANFQITTHSDYFLRHINDLIRLHVLKNKWKDDERYKDFCRNKGFNPDINIDPNVVSAYYLEKNEEGQVIVNKQNVDLGVPFDTFKKTVDTQLASSAELYDLVDE